MLAFTVGGQQNTSMQDWLDDGRGDDNGDVDDDDNDDDDDDAGADLPDEGADLRSKAPAAKLGQGLFGGLKPSPAKEPVGQAAPGHDLDLV
jgi:hypothetical protein